MGEEICMDSSRTVKITAADAAALIAEDYVIPVEKKSALERFIELDHRVRLGASCAGWATWGVGLGLCISGVIFKSLMPPLALCLGVCGVALSCTSGWIAQRCLKARRRKFAKQIHILANQVIAEQGNDLY